MTIILAARLRAPHGPINVQTYRENESMISSPPAEEQRPPGLRPLDVWPADEAGGEHDRSWIGVAVWGFVLLGVALRLIRYAMHFPLWSDESFFAINLIERTRFVDLWRPLEYGQIIPPFFLLVEWAAVRALGFNEWSLRLFPVVCGVASVFLFRHVASRMLRGVPLVFAVGVFAVSLHPIRHATEAKPYGLDLLAALLLLAPALEWLRAPERVRWLWLLAALVPLTLSLSHPAVFVAGGLALGLAWPVWRTRSATVRVPFAVYMILVAGTFLLLYALVTAGQTRATLDTYKSGDWAPAFPPLAHPLRLPIWFVSMNTGTMFAYPWGGPNGASSMATVCFVVAAVVLWRSRRRAALLVLLGPFLFTLLAAALGRYPYGLEARQMQFVAPAICILAGLGAAVILASLPWPRLRPGLIAASVVALVLTGGDLVRRDYAEPYRFRADLQARQFAKAFWPALEDGAEVACTREDFHVVNRQSLNLRTPIHVCNEWIYSPRRRQGRGPRLSEVSAERPLRCVLYHDTPLEIPETKDWLARMAASYDLRRCEPITVDMSGVKAGPKQEHWVVLEFVPKAGIEALTARPESARVR